MSNIFQRLIERTTEVTNTIGDKIDEGIDKANQAVDDVASFVINTYDAVVAPQRQAKEMNETKSEFQQQMFGTTLEENTFKNIASQSTLNDFITDSTGSLGQDLGVLSSQFNSGQIATAQQMQEQTNAILNKYKDNAKEYGINVKENLSISDLYDINDFGFSYLNGTVKKSQPTLTYNMFGQAEKKEEQGESFSTKIMNAATDALDDQYDNGLISDEDYALSIYQKKNMLRTAGKFESYLDQMKQEAETIVKYDPSRKGEMDRYMLEQEEKLANYSSIFLSTVHYGAEDGEGIASKLYKDKYGKSFLQDFSPPTEDNGIKNFVSGDGLFEGSSSEVYRSPLEYLNDESNKTIAKSKDASFINRVVSGTARALSPVNDVIDGIFDITTLNGSELEKVSLHEAKKLYRDDPTENKILSNVGIFMLDAGPDIIDLIVPAKRLGAGKLTKGINRVIGSAETATQISKNLANRYGDSQNIKKLISAIGASDTSKALKNLSSIYDPKDAAEFKKNLKLTTAQKLFADGLTESFYGWIVVDGKIQNMVATEYTSTDAWIGGVSEGIGGAILALKGMNRIYADMGTEIRRLIKENPEFQTKLGEEFWIRTGLDKTTGYRFDQLKTNVKNEFVELQVNNVDKALGIRERIPSAQKEGLAKAATSKMKLNQETNKLRPVTDDPASGITDSGVELGSYGREMSLDEYDELYGDMLNIEAEKVVNVEDGIKEIFVRGEANTEKAQAPKSIDLSNDKKVKEFFFSDRTPEEQAVIKPYVDAGLKKFNETLGSELDSTGNYLSLPFLEEVSTNEKFRDAIINEQNLAEINKKIISVYAGTPSMGVIHKKMVSDSNAGPIKETIQQSSSPKVKRKNRKILQTVQEKEVIHEINSKHYSKDGTGNIPYTTAAKIRESGGVLDGIRNYLSSDFDDVTDFTSFANLYQKFYGKVSYSQQRVIAIGQREELSNKQIFFLLRGFDHAKRGFGNIDLKDVVPDEGIRGNVKKILAEAQDGSPAGYLNEDIKILQGEIHKQIAESPDDADEIISFWKEQIGFETPVASFSSKNGSQLGISNSGYNEIVDFLDTYVAGKFYGSQTPVSKIKQIEEVTSVYNKIKGHGFNYVDAENIYSYTLDKIIDQGSSFNLAKDFPDKDYWFYAQSYEDGLKLIGVDLESKNLSKKINSFIDGLVQRYTNDAEELLGSSSFSTYISRVHDTVKEQLLDNIKSKLGKDIDANSELIEKEISSFDFSQIDKKKVIKDLSNVYLDTYGQNLKKYKDMKLNDVKKELDKQLIQNTFGVILNKGDNVYYHNLKSFGNILDSLQHTKKSKSNTKGFVNEFVSKLYNLDKHKSGISLDIGSKDGDPIKKMKTGLGDIILVDKNTYNAYRNHFVATGDPKTRRLLDQMYTPVIDGVDIRNGYIVSKNTEQLDSILRTAELELVRKGELSDTLDLNPENISSISDELKFADIKTTDSFVNDSGKEVVKVSKRASFLKEGINILRQKGVMGIENPETDYLQLIDEFFLPVQYSGVGFEVVSKKDLDELSEVLGSLDPNTVLERVGNYLGLQTSQRISKNDKERFLSDVVSLMYNDDLYKATEDFKSKYGFEVQSGSSYPSPEYSNLRSNSEGLNFSHRLLTSTPLRSTKNGSYETIKELGAKTDYASAERGFKSALSSLYARNKDFIDKKFKEVVSTNDTYIDAIDEFIEKNISSIQSKSGDGGEFDKDFVSLLQSDPQKAIEGVDIKIKTYVVIRDAVLGYSMNPGATKSKFFKTVNSGIYNHVLSGSELSTKRSNVAFNSTSQKTGLGMFGIQSELALDLNKSSQVKTEVMTRSGKSVGDTVAQMVNRVYNSIPGKKPKIKKNGAGMDDVFKTLVFRDIGNIEAPSVYAQTVGYSMREAVKQNLKNISLTLGIDAYNPAEINIAIKNGDPKGINKVKSSLMDYASKEIEKIFTQLDLVRGQYEGLSNADRQVNMITQVINNGSAMLPRRKKIYLGENLQFEFPGLDKVTIKDVAVDIFRLAENVTANYGKYAGKDNFIGSEKLKGIFDAANTDQERLNVIASGLNIIKQHADLFSRLEDTTATGGIPRYIYNQLATIVTKEEAIGLTIEGLYKKYFAPEEKLTKKMWAQSKSGDGLQDVTIQTYLKKYKPDEGMSVSEFKNFLSEVKFDNFSEFKAALTSTRYLNADDPIESVIKRIKEFGSIIYNAGAAKRVLKDFDPVALGNGDRTQLINLWSLEKKEAEVIEMVDDFFQQLDGSGISKQELRRMVNDAEEAFRTRRNIGGNSDLSGELVERADQKRFFKSNLERLNNEIFPKFTLTAEQKERMKVLMERSVSAIQNKPEPKELLIKKLIEEGTIDLSEKNITLMIMKEFYEPTFQTILKSNIDPKKTRGKNEFITDYINDRLKEMPPQNKSKGEFDLLINNSADVLC